MFKETKLYSVITGSCPVCHQESMYKESNPYNVPQVLKMHERCHHCGTKYKMEPSFFYGAMYVSYGVGIAFGLAAFIVSFLFFGGGLMTSFIAISITLILLMPVIMRVSRNIWINIFMDYDPSKAK
ncbi:MAG: DUF983 domain-containing protein [Flavobacteriaceae bacterium CG_4_8_14_3_um_filter_34_10]|nr:DUF983 domain-containing protein [Flavobacteriia bacterium]OIP51053.1 MAG: DUF983 domain-containing protein [Flavobacteriaceae bacterium CG2_30_34_30]PIQ19076.1 MAG: DUF983 domain-containing protein [Flavobacteriaceae bacterium CG18_big_fil_WC_8_21_14_2_50_34_36]PIV49308.1 MAG: DUF983 domain-containing protein [Flavobacteriaceae bacterium CG02_land_8_20_14_3_00_34_13]PIX10625.1 MAG: DUF983 domain-containing protein [Flavobacteriaceae bacterium CG_4_8_14_3_um_filter_34_10]PIZ07516.1 MAG: DUF